MSMKYLVENNLCMECPLINELVLNFYYRELQQFNTKASEIRL